MFDKLKNIWKNLFTEDKFPDKEKAEGDKRIGDVYDIEYKPSSEDPDGEMMLIFNKKEDE
jgi:hypothetical protein